ncbi:glycosyltransferase [Patiriisocius hiemis]|uniref:Glycosyltransferase n=1 Tax=Patiriisocius hiemis TaxID=3075604 RepID=A0ABU2YBK3_9FLAO|nr:glycosyltransferase [Constantimarinum sp. W242]MDT0555137.1 glycosyltransferase [Constantimarinum sp. W242]
MFQHFLITRFNLRKETWTTNKQNVAVLTEEWHENRFKLFKDYCFASVAAQTNKNFVWLVFFDTTTSEKYRLVIQELEQQLSNFKPVFVDGMDAFLPGIHNEIAKYNVDYIITSGLDNDDCIANEYVGEVQSNFDSQDFLAVDYVDGYTLQVAPKVLLGKKLHLYNPFMSLIEKNDTPKTFYAVAHRKWKKEKRVLQIRGKRIWSSVIHHENKINEFTGYGDVTAKMFFKYFSITSTKEDWITNEIIDTTKWRYRNLMNRVSSYFIFYSKQLKKKLGFYG